MTWGDTYNRHKATGMDPNDAAFRADRSEARKQEPFPQPRRKDGGKPCGECRIQPGEICDICGAVNTPPQTNVAGDPALIGIAEEMKESGGHWQPCTGCYDTEDGHPTRKYDYSPALQTEIGCGCHECGGLGAVWWHMTEAEIASYAEDMNAIDDDAIDAIQRLMDKKGLKRKDLFPAKSRASEYMSRKRPLSIATIRKLHFEHGIPAEVLIAPYRMASTEGSTDD